MRKILAGIVLILLCTGAVKEPNTDLFGGCASTRGTTVTVPNPTVATTPSYFTGEAQRMQDSK